MKSDFAVFICTHGRPNAQHTYNTLRKANYTGKIYLVLDNEDDTSCQYHALYDGVAQTEIVVFDKQHYIDTVDIGRLQAKRKAILYAKCACEDFAREFGLKSFVIADDDIVSFRFRMPIDNKLISITFCDYMDIIIPAYSQYILDANICATSFGTNQMYMGGMESMNNIGKYRIPYNFVFRNTSIPFSWISEMYEDSASPLMENKVGKYTIQLPFIKLEMKPVDVGASGGMSDTYKTMSIFQRISSLLQYNPSCVKFTVAHNMVTHSISRDYAFPKLISGSYKKCP